MDNDTYPPTPFHSLSRRLANDWLRTKDQQPIEQALAPLEGFEKKLLLGLLFWHAMQTADWQLAEVIFRQGYPIAPTDPNDFGPLHHSISLLGDRPDVIEWLIRYGAEVDRRGSNNRTPLIEATFGGLEETVARLLSSGADLNAGTVIDFDYTPLMAAALTGKTSIAEALIFHGADVARKSRYGDDAATLAESRGHETLGRLIRRRNTGSSR